MSLNEFNENNDVFDHQILIPIDRTHKLNVEKKEEEKEKPEEKKAAPQDEINLAGIDRMKSSFIVCCCGEENIHYHDFDNDDITANDFEWNQVGLLWLFILLMLIFSLIKYGPLISANYENNDCIIYSSVFSTECDFRWVYLTQCITYLLLAVTFCRGPNYRFVVAKQMKKANVLLFAFILLCIICLIEFVYTIMYFNSHHGWFIFELLIDICGYAMFFSYAPIVGKLAHFQDKIGRKTLIAHICFIFITVFTIIWLLIAMFFKLQVENSSSNSMAIVLIILESMVIIEWIHVVFECYQHKDRWVQENDEVVIIIPDHEDQGEDQQKEKESMQNIAKAVLLDYDINWNIFFYVAFLMQMTGFLYAFFKAFPAESESCSTSFEITFDIWNDCKNQRWIVQFVLYVIAAIILITRFCVMGNDEFKLFQFHRLYFAFIIWIILLLIECLFVYVVNKDYMLQVGIDFFGYLSMFIQALFVVIMRIYTSGDGGNPCCAKKIKYPILIAWIYFISVVLVLIWNFVVDIQFIQQAAEVLSNHYPDLTETTVEEIAFIQIVFENVLLIEYLHVMFGEIKYDKYLNN